MNTILITASHVNPAHVIAVDYNTNEPLIVGLYSKQVSGSRTYIVEVPPAWDAIDPIQVLRESASGAPAMPGPDENPSLDLTVTSFVDPETNKRVTLIGYRAMQ